MSNNHQHELKIVQQKVTKVNGQVIVRKYQKKQTLGKGGFATCYVAENIQTKRRYAMKIINKSILTKPKTKQKLLSQIRIHKSVSHKNIVQFYHVFEDQYYVYILLEICSNSNMFQLIRKRKKLTIPQVIYYIYQLVQALTYLHNNMIIHRDVKLGNLFINDKMELKLGDFGLASKLQFQGQRKRTVCGTPNYIAPEIIQNLKGHSYEVDIWSTGVILYIFLNGCPPFETDNLEKTYNKIKSGDFKPMSLTNKFAIDLIRKTLTTDPAKRITFKQFLQHPFMNPQGGILKTLPTRSLIQIPNLKQHQKYSDQQMRLTRVNSITTLKPQQQLGLQSIQQKQKDEGSKLKKSGSISSLFKSLMSPSSKIQRSNSLQLLKNNQQKQYVSKSKQKEIISSKKISNTIIYKKKKQLYVYRYKIDVVISYAMTNGLIGTCQQKLKILYSKKTNCYYQITQNDSIRLIPAEKVTQDIQNRRKKFLNDLVNQYQQVDNFKQVKNLIYVKKVLKTQNAILFKLSNNVLQASFPQTENIMLVTQDQIILIPKGNIENIIKQKKQNYLNCKKLQLIKCYRFIVEIMNRNKQ